MAELVKCPTCGQSRLAESVAACEPCDLLNDWQEQAMKRWIGAYYAKRAVS